MFRRNIPIIMGIKQHIPPQPQQPQQPQSEPNIFVETVVAKKHSKFQKQ